MFGGKRRKRGKKTSSHHQLPPLLSLLPPPERETSPRAPSLPRLPPCLPLSPPFGLPARMTHRVYPSWRAGLSSSSPSSFSLQDGVRTSVQEAVEEHRHGGFLGQIR